MQPVPASKLTSKGQTTIPEPVRRLLDLHPGDSVAFEIVKETGAVVIRKVRPLDAAFSHAIEGTLTDEWLSPNDEAAYGDL